MSLTVQPIRFTDNVDEMTRLLVALGLSVSVTSNKGGADHPEESMIYDEAYGRAITITSGADELTINGHSDDPYGYTSTGVTPGPDTSDLRVTPIRFVDDQTPDRRLLEALGFSLVGAADPAFTQLTLPDPGGANGLHHIYTDELPVVPGPFAIQLTFETATALPDIVQRARSAGAEAKLNESEFGDFATVTDADGQQIQVHPASA